MKKRLLSLALAGAMTLSLAACRKGEPVVTPTPKPTPTATPVPVAAEFALPLTGGSIHPILGRDRVNLSLGGLLWEGLFTLDNTFTPQKLLCESYSVSEDGLTWTFQLKTGVTFSDGSALTPADAVAALKQAMANKSRYAGRLSGVRSVGAGEGGVILTLAYPNGALPALLDIPIVKGTDSSPIGTGPYAIVDEGTALQARTDWWQKKSLLLQRIPLRTISQADDLISAFSTGEVTMVTADLSGTNFWGYSGSYETWDYPTSTMLYVGFNTTRGACAEPLVRQAISRMFDRAAVAGVLYSGHASESELPVSVASPLYNVDVAAALSYSPPDAERLFAEAGYVKDENGRLMKGKKALSLVFAVNTDNSFRVQSADFLAQALQSAGATVEVRKLSWSDYEMALASGGFDLYLGETMLSADFDPSALVALSGGLNFGKYTNQETNELLTAFRAAAGSERITAAKALYGKLCQDVPFAPLCFKNQSVLTQWGRVRGLTPTQSNPFYGLEHWTLQ